MKSWDKRKRMKELVRVQKGRCYYCNRSPHEEDRTIDHRIPLSKGGTDTRKNLVMACEDCNSHKGSMSEREFTEYLEKKKSNV